MFYILLIILYVICLTLTTSFVTYRILKKSRQWKGREVPNIPSYEDKEVYVNLSDFQIQKHENLKFPSSLLNEIKQINPNISPYLDLNNNLLQVPKEWLYKFHRMLNQTNWQWHPQWDMIHDDKYADIVIEKQFYIQGKLQTHAKYPRATPMNIQEKTEI